MQKIHESILRAINNTSKKYNILTFACHERYQSNLSSLPHSFYMWKGQGIKHWNSQYAEIPQNHTMLDGSDFQIRPDMKFDMILSQNKYGNFQVAHSLAMRMNLPIISIEHTLPHVNWTNKHVDQMKQMRGNINAFISEYSIAKWGFDKNDPTVRIVRHAIDTEKFKPKDDGHNDGKILTVANDWINRDWCQPAGQKILTDHGYVGIEHIKIGDVVLSDDGLYHNVVKTFNRKYHGPMSEIYLKGVKKPLLFTSDHSIRVFRDGMWKYIESSRIKENEILRFPDHVQTDFSCDDEDLAWLVGLIIGDGSIKRCGGIEIIFKNEYIKIAEKAKTILEKLTGNKASISIRDRKRNPDSKVFRLECTSKIFGSWLKEKIGGKSFNKSIPDFIFRSSQKIRLKVLEGLWFCDGSLESSKDKNGYHHNRACYSTISLKLASQVSSILHTMGHHFGIKKEYRTTNKCDREVFIYRVYNCSEKDFPEIEEILKNSKLINKGYSYIVRKAKTIDEWNGTVYNCQVAEDPSYVVYPGFVAHNCCDFNLYKQVCLNNKMPTNPIGDTPGLSKPAKGVDDLVSKYQNASVFFNTSKISPIPMSLLEAMSSATPCVSTRNCMIPEIIEDGVNGFISNDPKILKDRLEWCLKNPEEARAIGDNARKTIVERFNLKQHLDSWNRIFDEVYGKGYHVFYN